VPKSRTPEGELTKTEQALKRRTSEKDTSKANQTGDMDELTNKKPRVRRKKEKAPLPPQPAATQPLPSTEEEEKTKKQLKELKAEEKKPKLLTVPVDKPLVTCCHFSLLLIVLSSDRLGMKLVDGRNFLCRMLVSMLYLNGTLYETVRLSLTRKLWD
jgi:hypothetical protein